MNLVFGAVLLSALSSIATLAQNTTLGEESYHWAGLSREYTGRATLTHEYFATFDAAKTFTGRMYDNATATPLFHLQRMDWQSAPDGSAAFKAVVPFRYTSAKDRSDYFLIKLGPVRYTFRPDVSESKKPAGGFLQNLVDGILRHYTSDPVVPVNKRCLRALSCNSLYEQALRQRAAPSTTR